VLKEIQVNGAHVMDNYVPSSHMLTFHEKLHLKAHHKIHNQERMAAKQREDAKNPKAIIDKF
jgi:hypothetical protein